MPPASAQLLLDDAVPLAQAWAQHVAELHDIRIVFLKGRGLQHHGLRPPRTSSDIDVLVEPGAQDAFADAIEAAGWRERPGSFASARFTVHSRAFVHPEWPCDLDVHTSFPGFLAPDADVFEELWRRSELIDVAQQSCRIPDRASSAAVLGLHSLRGSELLPRHRDEFDHLVSVLLPDDLARDDLRRLALATGCVDTLEALWSALGVSFTPAQRGGHPKELRAWRERVSSGSWGAYSWLASLRSAGWRERATLVRHALWPSAADIRLDHPEVGPRRRDLAIARWQRLGRGLRSTPRAVSAILRHRRG